MGTWYRSKRGALLIGESASWGQPAAAQNYIKTKEVTTPAGEEYRPGDDITQKDAEDIGAQLLAPGDLSFKMGLHPWSSTWPTAKPILGAAPPISHPLKAILGGVFAGGYGVTSSGNTTTVLQFSAYGVTPTVMGFVRGQGVFVRDSGATNVLGFNVIKDLDDLAFTITLRHPLPSAPGNAAVVYGAYSWPKLPTATPQDYQITWLGEAASDKCDCYGCVAGSGSIAAPFRGVAELSVGFHCAQPIPMVLGESGGNPAVQTYDYPDASQVIAGGLYLWDGASLLKLNGGANIDFGVESTPVDGINGVDPNGIAGYVMTARKIRIKLDEHLYHGANTLFDYFRNPPATSMLTGWWGRGPAAWGFQIPACMLVNPPAKGDKDGALLSKLEFGAAEYTGDTGSFADDVAGDKPFVLCQLAGA
jgi:hypothetical protein